MDAGGLPAAGAICNEGKDRVMGGAVKVFVFSDALGFELVSRHHFLEKELPFRYRLRTQLGYSSTAVPTILTGTPPTVHRHFSFFFLDRAGESPFRAFRFLGRLFHPRFIFDNHRVRNRVSRFWKKLFGFTGYFNLYRVPYERLPLLDYCEKRDIFAPGGLAPVENLRDMLERSGVRYHISDWRRSDAENLREARELLERGEVEFLFVYTAGLDGMLHFHVGDHAFEAGELERFGESVRELMAAAARGGRDWELALFSDHGMTPLRFPVDLRSRLEATRFRFGRDFAACYDSTMLRLYLLTPECRETLMKTLDGAPGHWLSEEEKRSLHIDFEDRQYGDEIFLLDPGVQLAPGDMGGKPIPGMHGYTPDDPDSDACLLCSREPGFVPEEIAGLFTLMKRGAEALRKADAR